MSDSKLIGLLWPLAETSKPSDSTTIHDGTPDPFPAPHGHHPFRPLRNSSIAGGPPTVIGSERFRIDRGETGFRPPSSKQSDRPAARWFQHPENPMTNSPKKQVAQEKITCHNWNLESLKQKDHRSR